MNLEKRSKRRKSSEIWTKFANMGGGFHECSECGAWVKSAGNSTSNLHYHYRTQHAATTTDSNSQQVNDGQSNRNDKITKVILFMVVKDLLPLSIIESEGFRALLRTVCPSYKPPCRRTLSDLIHKTFLKQKELVPVQTFSNLIAITTDIWTDTHTTTAYIGATFHAIKNFEMKSVLVSVKALSGQHRADDVSSALKSILTEYNIDINIVQGIVTDSGRNMVLACQNTFGEEKHVRCFAHTLNLICQQSIASVLDMADIINKVRDIATHFKHSTIANTALLKSQESEGIAMPIKLKRDVATRWNSVYDMLMRFVKLYRHICFALKKCGSTLLIPDSDELEKIRDILTVIEPIYEMTTEICSEKHVTLSKVIPMVKGAKMVYTEKRTSDVAESLRIAVLKGFEERFKAIGKSKIHAVSTLMDPRFKKLYYTPTEASHASALVLQEMEAYDELTQEACNHCEPVIWKYHDSMTSTETTAKKEFSKYLSLPPLHRTNNPLQFWKQYEKAFPKLAPIGLKYLVVPATSVPCERLFSKTGGILNEKRSRLKPSKVEAIAFLGSLTLDEILF